MKRILIDVDGVLADLVGALCSRLSWKATEENITTYNFGECLSPEDAGIFEATMAEPGFAASLPWYEGAKDMLAQMHKEGDVVILTKPFHKSKTWVYDRNQWLKGYADKIIHTGHKEYVSGDVLIEDSVENARKWQAAHPRGQVILIPRPWNRHVIF